MNWRRMFDSLPDDVGPFVRTIRGLGTRAKAACGCQGPSSMP